MIRHSTISPSSFWKIAEQNFFPFVLITTRCNSKWRTSRLLRCEVSRNRGKRLILLHLSLKVLQDKTKKTRIEPDIPPFSIFFCKDVTWCDFGRIHHVPMDQEDGRTKKKWAKWGNKHKTKIIPKGQKNGKNVRSSDPSTHPPKQQSECLYRRGTIFFLLSFSYCLSLARGYCVCGLQKWKMNLDVRELPRSHKTFSLLSFFLFFLRWMEKHLRLRNLIWCRFYVFVWCLVPWPRGSRRKKDRRIFRSFFFLSFFRLVVLEKQKKQRTTK